MALRVCLNDDEVQRLLAAPSPSRSVSEVADGLGINRNMLTRWKAQFEAQGALAFPSHDRRAEAEAEAEIRRLNRELSIAQQERDIPEKCRGLLRERKDVRFEFVRDHRESFEVVLLCTTLRVSRSGFYAWRDRDESDRARENRDLT